MFNNLYKSLRMIPAVLKRIDRQINVIEVLGKIIMCEGNKTMVRTDGVREGKTPHVHRPVPVAIPQSATVPLLSNVLGGQLTPTHPVPYLSQPTFDSGARSPSPHSFGLLK